MQKDKRGYRTEKDSLGSRKIPNLSYYGIETARALENFPISGLHFQKKLIYALAMLKKAAALAHEKAGELDSKRAKAIAKASDEIIAGKLDNEFQLDVFQAGAGTSEHMNVNEVIANRALELLKHRKGQYDIINPHNHVNLGQSTNDVFHSAIHVAAYLEIKQDLVPALEHLHKNLQKKATSFAKIAKSGRTHLRDALPITLGQEFSGYASIIDKNLRNINKQKDLLLELNLGGTALGTKVNASEKYRNHVYQSLQGITNAKFKPSKNLFSGTQSLFEALAVHSALKTLAADLIKIANDLRLLSSGPTTGFNEISLPAVQEGSSIMPGKVNPSIAEMVDMVSFQVIGNDSTLTLCSQAGQLELNVMMPLAAYSLLNSIEILSRSIEIFADKCISGIKPNKEKCLQYLEKNPIIVTALTPKIGYEKAAQIAQKAYQQDKSVKEIVLKEKLMSEKEFDSFISTKKLINSIKR
jgi:aspartate ammonia-lyase